MTLPGSIILVGFGSQARAWALNLRDSRQSIKIALRVGSPARSKAEAMGFECINLENEDLNNHSLFLMLIPDNAHLSFSFSQSPIGSLPLQYVGGYGDD